MSKITNIILGGAGLLGSALDRALKQRGEHTLIYDLKSDFDLRDKIPPIPSGRVYYWFLAWEVGGAKFITNENAQVEILHSNMMLMSKVFEWLQSGNHEFTFVSTQMVGYPNAYGMTKQIAEYWVQQLENGLIARLWNCYGAEKPSQRSHVIPDLIERAAKLGRIELMTSGIERRQFLHADDVADALILHREKRLPLVDITSGDWVSIRNIADIIAEQFDAVVIPSSEIGYESLIEPTNLLLEWSPKIDLVNGIQYVVDTMRERGWVKV